MKIRGTPAHIAEKYLTLARDAQSSGDPVLAENYLQHAEHYSRIIMAYREQLQQTGEMPNGNGTGQRLLAPNDPGEGDDFGDDDGGDDMLDDGLPQPMIQHHQNQQHRQGGGGGGGGRQSSGYDANRDRPFRRDRDQGRFRERERFNDRGGDRERSGGDNRQNAAPQERQPEAPAEGGGGGDNRRRDRFQQPHEQPEFLRRPVRRARSENGEPAAPKDEPRE